MTEIEFRIASAENEFFSRRGWKLKQCPFCNRGYYTKRDLPSCGSYNCSGGYLFLNHPSPKAYLRFNECADRLRTFFSAAKFQLSSPIAIPRKDERTLFASTAGQIYDDLIYGRNLCDYARRCATLQPVIRLQDVELIPSLDGVSTSFVHSATESWNIQPDEHFNTLDKWFDFFSANGLYVGNICLRKWRENNNWSAHTVTSETLDINYAGLEIGIANFFFNIPQLSGAKALMSDIGVGFERLVWAINKSPSYFDGIGPLSDILSHKREGLDALRTATLIAAFGITPDHKNHGSKLRAMIGIAAKESKNSNLYELVRYYYRQWASFIALPLSHEQTYLTIWHEINRSLNLKTNLLWGVDESIDQENDDYLWKLINKKSIPIKHFWNFKRRII